MEEVIYLSIYLSCLQSPQTRPDQPNPAQTPWAPCMLRDGCIAQRPEVRLTRDTEQKGAKGEKLKKGSLFARRPDPKMIESGRLTGVKSEKTGVKE